MQHTVGYDLPVSEGDPTPVAYYRVSINNQNLLQQLNKAQNVFSFTKTRIRYTQPSEVPFTAYFRLKLSSNLRAALGLDVDDDEWLDFGTQNHVIIDTHDRAVNPIILTSTGSQSYFNWVYSDIVGDSPGIHTTDRFKLLRFVSSEVLYPEHFLPIIQSRISNINVKISGTLGYEERVVLTLHFCRMA